jgi:sterol desaturase/sphingolipid hydroxylase (fatty acid hydroxylase superfamily)
MHRLHHARASTTQRCNFGNNLSIFEWLFAAAVLRDALPEEFGLDDEAYPEGNIVRQFFYAFRPFPAERSVNSNAPIPAYGRGRCRPGGG